MLTSKVKGLLVALGMLASVQLACAGGAASGGATEWTQIMNNLQLVAVASDSAQTSIASVQAHITQLEQFRVQVENTRGLNPSAMLSQMRSIDAEINKWSFYKNKMESLQGSLAQQHAAIDNRVTESRLNGGDFNTYLQRKRNLVGKEAEIEKARLEREKQIVDKTTEDAKFVQEMSAEIKGSTSQRRDAQIMNMQLNRLVTQNNSMIELLVQGQRNAGGVGRVDKAADAKDAAELANKMRARKVQFEERW